MDGEIHNTGMEIVALNIEIVETVGISYERIHNIMHEVLLMKNTFIHQNVSKKDIKKSCLKNMQRNPKGYC